MAILPVDKPLGPTSHDIVAGARRQLSTRKVGHAGTLDPLATGVLVLLTEEHTRLSPFLTESVKHYLAWVSFGATTPTLDAEGPLVPGTVPETGVLEGELPGRLQAFLDLESQVPPNYSAVRIQGVRGYEAARRGEEQELPSRPARYHEVELLAVADSALELPATFAAGDDGAWRPAPSGVRFDRPADLAVLPSALFRLSVAAGTYIRSFARDLGEQLGCGAFLSGLVRTRAGLVDLGMTVPADQLAGARGVDPLAVLKYPAVQLEWGLAERVRQGQRLRPDFTGRAVMVDPDGQLVAVAQEQEGRMKLLAVWPRMTRS
jgi:tRNA pseudouridine55 synthase